MKQNTKHKIGLYIRVSTEEQAENPEGSIKNQEQRLRSCIDFKNQESPFGEVTRVFIDRAKSGKDTNRPELQKLLNAIRNKEITLVMVSELSRLSRSIKDFCEIWDLMRINQCEFQSLREQFDTTTAAGEMVLYTIANIAQFERKQCSERVSANVRARAERGLYNGGPVPIGYEIDPDKRGHLRINPEHAEVIIEAFNTFLEAGSLATAGKVLNDKGIKIPKKRQGGGGLKPRLGHFTVDNLHDILRNKAYLGLKKYKDRNGEVQYSKACWEPIIDESTFTKANTILKQNFRRYKPQYIKKYPFLLTSITWCVKCGDRLVGKTAHGNTTKVPYYEHGWATKRQAFLNKKVFECKPLRFQAKVLEPLIWNEVINLLSNKEVAEELITDAKYHHESQSITIESDKLKIKITSIENQIDALAEHLTKIPKGVNPESVFNQMQKLQMLKTETKAVYDKKLQSGEIKELPINLKDYTSFLKWIKEFINIETTSEIKQKIIQKLIHKVEIKDDLVKIYLYTGQDQIISSIGTNGEGSNPSPNLSKNFSSHTLTSGGPTRTRTWDHPVMSRKL